MMVCERALDDADFTTEIDTFLDGGLVDRGLAPIAGVGRERYQTRDSKKMLEFHGQLSGGEFEGQR